MFFFHLEFLKLYRIFLQLDLPPSNTQCLKGGVVINGKKFKKIFLVGSFEKTIDLLNTNGQF